MATTSHETFGVAGRLGLPIFVGLRATDMNDLKVSLASYRKAWSDAGHTDTPSAYVRIPVYAAATERAAIEEPRESIAAFFERQSALARSPVGRAGAGPAEKRSFQAERMKLARRGHALHRAGDRVARLAAYAER